MRSYRLLMINSRQFPTRGICSRKMAYGSSLGLYILSNVPVRVETRYESAPLHHVSHGTDLWQPTYIKKKLYTHTHTGTRWQQTTGMELLDASQVPNSMTI